MERFDYMSLLENNTTLDIRVFDPISFDTSDFLWTEGFREYVLQEIDIQKPYRISRFFYGTAEYMDILLLLNNVENHFDLKPGFTMYIPDLTELRNWLLTKRRI